MPKRCCVPKCNVTNLKNISVFSFPSNEEKINLWKSQIPREDLVVTKNTGICSQHFSEDHIIREDRMILSNGKELIIQRKKPKLSEDAIPSIFASFPSIAKKSISVPKKSPKENGTREKNQKKEKINDFIDLDLIGEIKNLNDTSQYNCNNWLTKDDYRDESFCFYLISDSFPLKVNACLQINTDFTINIQIGNYRLDSNDYEWILGDDLVCDKFSKLESLLQEIQKEILSKLSSHENIDEISNNVKISTNNVDEDEKQTLTFSSEQFLLFFKKKSSLDI